jgi:tetratricopeptide (TPR) repeat protein
LVIVREIGDRGGEGDVLTNLGIVYQRLGQYPRAFTTFQESLRIHEALGILESLWLTQRDLASVEVQLNQPASAITHYEQALDTIKALRAGLTEKAQKLSFMQNKLYVYDELITLLHDLHQQHPNNGYDRKALDIFERKQGRVFLEEMGQSGARNFAGLPEPITQRERDLETQLEQTRTQLADERAKLITEQQKALIQTLEARENTLHAEQAALQEQIKTDYPDYYALKYPTPVALEDLQHTVLQPGELLLVYSVMKEKTCL